MSNLKEFAFPFVEGATPEESINPGFTKHEIATIFIAGHLAGKLSFSTDDIPHIANVAHKIAQAVLGKFE